MWVIRQAMQLGNKLLFAMCRVLPVKLSGVAITSVVELGLRGNHHALDSALLERLPLYAETCIRVRD
jgi:hypothetical protein